MIGPGIGGNLVIFWTCVASEKETNKYAYASYDGFHLFIEEEESVSITNQC